MSQLLRNAGNTWLSLASHFYAIKIKKRGRTEGREQEEEQREGNRRKNRGRGTEGRKTEVTGGRILLGKGGEREVRNRGKERWCWAERGKQDRGRRWAKRR